LKIIRPSVRILYPEDAANALQRIEYAARISHRSEEDAGLKTERFIRDVVLAHGDWSVVEHVSVSVEFVVDRGITHELVRHRIAAYTQESTRFVNYEKKMPPSFIYPKPDVECSMCMEPNGCDNHCFYKPPQQGDWIYNHAIAGGIEQGGTEYRCAYDGNWLQAIYEAEAAYKRLLVPTAKGGPGWRPQEARSVFPNALASKIVATLNLRSWRQVLLMRTTGEAHPQMRQVMNPLLEQFKTLIPVLYEDIEPGARQVDNIKKGR
jgi:thymidylate synthase (FAD)